MDIIYLCVYCVYLLCIHKYTHMHVYIMYNVNRFELYLVWNKSRRTVEMSPRCFKKSGCIYLKWKISCNNVNVSLMSILFNLMCPCRNKIIKFFKINLVVYIFLFCDLPKMITGVNLRFCKYTLNLLQFSPVLKTTGTVSLRATQSDSTQWWPCERGHTKARVSLRIPSLPF